MPLAYTAPEHVRRAIAGLGRTEDVRFSPDNRRLAIASFLRNRIAIFDIVISDPPGGRQISLTDLAEISSPHLKFPHGIDFIDNSTIIVANRQGDATIFELPPGGGDYELVPVEVICSGDVLESPGNVFVTKRNKSLCEALICSNFGNKLTRHQLDLNGRCTLTRSEIVLRKWLDLPDGVSVSGSWIAISNHNSHNVFLYDSAATLSEDSDPDGILRCSNYPHGLRFTSDGRFLLVADAGAPYVHIYARDGSGWRGVRSPAKSIKVMRDEDFLRGRTSVHEGGRKGLDVDAAMSTLVITCETQPLTFFDLADALERLSLMEAKSSSSLDEAERTSYGSHWQDQRAFEIRFELDRHEQYKQDVALLMNTKSWRYTAPLRAIYGALKKLVHMGI